MKGLVVLVMAIALVTVACGPGAETESAIAENELIVICPMDGDACIPLYDGASYNIIDRDLPGHSIGGTVTIQNDGTGTLIGWDLGNLFNSQIRDYDSFSVTYSGSLFDPVAGETVYLFRLTFS